jgi:hypothetical protein
MNAFTYPHRVDEAHPKLDRAPQHTARLRFVL